MGLFKKGCFTNAVAPAPDPSRWELLYVKQYAHAHVLSVRYLDCTNFEGVKIMVFRGEYEPRAYLDPHFSIDPLSPIARFRPDRDGIALAEAFAASLTP